MKGKVLGFSVAEGTGAISAEDGKRYSFTHTDWRSDKPIIAGMQVDFDVRDGQAIDIYPAAGGSVDLSQLTTGLSAAGDAAVVGKFLSLLKGTLAFPLALLVIIAFFLPTLVTPVKTFTLFDIDQAVKAATSMEGSVADYKAQMELLKKQEAELKRAIKTQGANARTVDGYNWDGSPNYYGDAFGAQLKTVVEQQATIKAGISRANSISFLKNILILRFAALVAAVALIWLAWKGQALSLLSLVAGAAALISAAMPFAFKSMIVDAATKNNPFGELVSAAIDNGLTVGIAPWLLLLGGAGLILSGLGLVKNPLAGK